MKQPDFKGFLGELCILVATGVILPYIPFLRKLYEQADCEIEALARDLSEAFVNRTEWYAQHPEVYDVAGDVLPIARACCDCAWRCPSYDSIRCKPCRYVYGSPFFEREKHPGYGTKAVEEKDGDC